MRHRAGHEVARMRRCGERLQRQRRKPRHGELPVLPLRLRPVASLRGSAGAMRHSSSAAGHRPKRKMTRAASADACVPTCAPIDALVAVLMAGTQRGLFSAASWVFWSIVVGIAGRDQPEHVVGVDARHRHFVGDGAEMCRDTVGERGADAVAHLDMVAIDRDPAVAVDFHASERAVGAGAVILGDAGHAGADENAALRARFFLRPLLPDRMRLELVENLRRADRDAVAIAHHGAAIRLERVAPPELDRVERQRRRRLVDQHLQRRHRLQRAVAAHRARGDAARMQRDRGDVDLRNVVDADRGGRAAPWRR